MGLREGGLMQLVLLIIAWLAYLYYGFPSRVKWAIKRDPIGGGEKQSGILMVVGILVFVTVYLTLVFLGESTVRAWQRTEPAVTALAIAGAILFSAVKLFPPMFYVAYFKVVDWATGEYETNRLDEVTIKRGQWWPVYLAIHSTSTFTWESYRITICLPSGVEAIDFAEGFPESKKWNFAPKEGSLTIGSGYIQKPSTSVLTIGETLATRFFVRSTSSGSFRLLIQMTSTGRIGERCQSLKLRVEE